MRCEVQNMDPSNVNLTKVKINWSVNYAPLPIDDDRRIHIVRKAVS